MLLWCRNVLVMMYSCVSVGKCLCNSVLSWCVVLNLMICVGMVWNWNGFIGCFLVVLLCWCLVVLCSVICCGDWVMVWLFWFWFVENVVFFDVCWGCLYCGSVWGLWCGWDVLVIGNMCSWGFWVWCVWLVWVLWVVWLCGCCCWVLWSNVWLFVDRVCLCWVLGLI